MTVLENTKPALHGAAATARGRLAAEFADTLKLAAPMALTQLGQIVMMTTDLALIGRLGEEAVAAAALASTVYFVSFTIALGVVSAVAPLAAQAFGARDLHRVRRSLRVGLWAALLISLPMVTFPLYGEQILRLLGQAEAPSKLAQTYLLGLVWGATPALWLIAIRGFMGALNRPEPVLWITLAAIPANGLLVYLLIHGAGSRDLALPPLGLFGAGIATTIINFAMFLAGLWFAVARRPFSKYHVMGNIWRIDWAMMRQLIAIGGPISIAFMMEYGLFSSAALLTGLIGTTALAAHQIALQVTAVLFMVPLGIGMAATVRVGHAVGRNDAAGVRRAGLAAAIAGPDDWRRPDPDGDRRPVCDRAAFPRPCGRKRGGDDRPRRDAAAGRRHAVYRRWRSNHHGGIAARHEGHAYPAVVRRDRLLADRLSHRLGAGLPG